MKTKYFLLTSSILFYSFHSSAQNSFIKKINDSASVYVNWIKTVTSDDNVLIIGSSNSYCTKNCDNSIYVSELSKDGLLILSKKYSSSYSFRNAYVRETDGGDFFIVADVYDDITKMFNAVAIIKCKRNGDVQWSKSIQTSNTLHSEFVSDKISGNMIITLYNNENPIIFCLDKAGNKKWSEIIKPVHGTDYHTIYHRVNALKIYDGIIYAGGTSTCADCYYECHSSKGFIMKFNLNDGSTFSNNFQRFGQIYSNTYYDCNEANAFDFAKADSVVFVLSYMDQWYTSDTPPYYYIFPFLDRPASTPSKQIPDDPFSLQHFFQHKTFTHTDLDFFSDGSMIYGFYDTIKKYDKNGRICPDYKENLFDTTVTDQRIAVWQNHFSISALSLNSMNIQITNSIGKGITTVCNNSAQSNSLNLLQLEKIKEQEEISVYPNPVKNILNIRTADIHNFILLNVDGKILVSKTINNEGFIDVSNFSAGIYFLKSLNNGKVIKIIIDK